MSRHDLSAVVHKVMRQQDDPKVRRDLFLVMKILSGGWTPTTAARRPDEYTCLGYVGGKWVQVSWDKAGQEWWSDKGYCEPEAFAPYPMLPERVRSND